MEQLKKVNEEIKELNDKIEQATLGRGEYKNISEEKISKIQVKLEAQLVKLEADKERWFKLVEEEKRNEYRKNAHEGTIIYEYLFIILKYFIHIRNVYGEIGQWKIQSQLFIMILIRRYFFI